MALDVYPPRNLPGSSEEWGRVVETRVDSNSEGLQGVRDSLQGLNRSTASSLQELARQIQALPVTATNTVTDKGFAGAGAMTVRLTMTLTVPPGKSQATVFAVGNAAVVDTGGTGGLPVAYMDLQIDGETSPQYSASKDHGATAINNVLSGAFSRTVGGKSSIVVNLRIGSTNASAYPAMPGNYGNLSVIAVYE